MSNKQEAIRNAAKAVQMHGLALPADLDKLIADLSNPQYRVAVVGRYQVGKSTLVNRLFHGGEPLLAEGRGLCTTAVATDNEYGPEPKMEVYDWADASRTAETLVRTVENPTGDDVNDATVSSSMETRAELAKKRSRVRILSPNEALRGYAVCDTPGLDDPNQELLLDTTWRIIPRADVALLVVEGDRQLGDRELELLRKDIMGRNGIARLMVLVSFNPATMALDADGRKKVLETIRSQLANIGRSNIPVEMYCFDPDLGDIWCDARDILQLIRKFLAANALPGREEKVANLLRAEIEKDLVEIAAKIKATGLSAEEREALRRKVEEEVALFKEKAEQAFGRFRDGMETLRNRMGHEVDLAVDGVFARFLSEVEKQDSPTAMQRILDNAGSILRADLQDKMSIVGLNLKTRLDTLAERYAGDLAEGGREWQLFLSEEFDIRTGFAAKIPEFVVDILNVFLLNFLLPGGWIPAILAELLARPVLNPGKTLLSKAIAGQLKAGLKEARAGVRDQIMEQIDEAIRTTFADVKSSMEASNQAQVKAIRAALDEPPAAAAGRAALESAKADLEACLASLQP